MSVVENNNLDFSWAEYNSGKKPVSFNNEKFNKNFTREELDLLDKLFCEDKKEKHETKTTSKVVKKPKHSIRGNTNKKVVVCACMTAASIMASSWLFVHLKNKNKVIADNYNAADVNNDENKEVENPVVINDDVYNNYIAYEGPMYTFKEIDLNMPLKATRYLTDEDYNNVINKFGSTINEYSTMYGVDPNVVASLIMVECPRYEIEKDTDYHQIGLGQYKGEYFDHETFKAYNYVTNEVDSFTVDVEKNLFKNPENQIKLICMTLEESAITYDYNLVAMLEHHNKGCGSVSNALEKIKNEYGYNSKEEVLKYANPELITECINKIGDPNYTYKVCYYIDKCLENHTFNNDDYLTFKDYKTGVDVNISLKIENEKVHS